MQQTTFEQIKSSKRNNAQKARQKRKITIKIKERKAQRRENVMKQLRLGN